MSNTTRKTVDCCIECGDEEADEHVALGNREEEHVSTFEFILLQISFANFIIASVSIIAVVRIINR